MVLMFKLLTYDFIIDWFLFGIVSVICFILFNYIDKTMNKLSQ
jgi:hypothetical protein